MSVKRARQLREYRKLRKAFLAAHILCARCKSLATEVHHKAGRSGGRLLDVTGFVALCSGCHRTVTENPAWAVEQGYSLRRVGAK